MKQSITIDQLNELSPEARKTLRYWCIEHHVDATPIRVETCLEPAPYDMEHLPNIGQMIEFLFDNDFSPTIISDDHAFYWIVEPQKHQLCWKKEEYANTELVDALWEAVKEILEK